MTDGHHIISARDLQALPPGDATIRKVLEMRGVVIPQGAFLSMRENQEHHGFDVKIVLPKEGANSG